MSAPRLRTHDLPAAPRNRRGDVHASRRQGRERRGYQPPVAAPRTELARYIISSGPRVLVRYGSPAAGSLWDEPAGGEGKRYLVERRLDFGSLPHLLADYLEQSRLRDCPAMVVDLGVGAESARRSWPPAASLAA